jgi:hypothetical protein
MPQEEAWPGSEYTSPELTELKVDRLSLYDGVLVQV